MKECRVERHSIWSFIQPVYTPCFLPWIRWLRILQGIPAVHSGRYIFVFFRSRCCCRTYGASVVACCLVFKVFFFVVCYLSISSLVRLRIFNKSPLFSWILSSAVYNEFAHDDSNKERRVFYIIFRMVLQNYRDYNSFRKPHSLWLEKNHEKHIKELLTDVMA